MSEAIFDSLGRRLKAKREEAGRSLREIADVTKIQVRYLEDLESGDHSLLPAPVFVKGFLSAFALEVGLDPAEVLEEYKALAPPVKEGEPVPITLRNGLEPSSYLWLAALAMLVVVIGAVVWAFGPWKTGPAEKPAPVPQTETRARPQPAVPEQAPAKAAEPGPAEKPSLVQQPAPEEEPAPSREVAALEPETSPGPENSPPEPAAAEAPPPPPAAGHELSLIFTETSWVGIVIDNGGIKQYFFEPGQKKTWTAKKGFSLRLGNARGVQAIFNGQTVSRIGPGGPLVLDLLLPPDSPDIKSIDWNEFGRLIR